MTAELLFVISRTLYLTLILTAGFCSLSAQKHLRNFRSISNITLVGNKIFFAADDGVSGAELWGTEGTSENTVLVKDINSGYNGSNPSNFINYKGVLYFTAYLPGFGTELWKSDGTVEGTTLVKDINIYGNQYNNGSNPSSLVVFKDHLYFVASQDNYRFTLYRSDGTSTGTMPIYSEYGYIKELVTSPTYLYFTSGNKLMRTDGTTEGTSSIATDNNYYVSDLTRVGDRIFFITFSSYYQDLKLYSLLSSVGQPALMKEFTVSRYTSHEIGNFCPVGNELFFSLRADDFETETEELWISNGTSDGTRRIKTFLWERHWAESGMKNFIAYKGQAYFRGGSTAGFKFYKSDGTESGTHVVHDIAITAPNYVENPPVISNGKLFFSGGGDLTSGGDELWTSDGTSAGTMLFADINQNGSSWPRGLCDADGVLYFAADDGSGLGLWNNMPAPEINVTQSWSSIPSGGKVVFNSILPGDCAKQTIDLINVGNKELFISGVSITGKDFYLEGKLPEVIKPKEKAVVNIFFIPIESGKRTGTLTVLSSDENESNYQINLEGVGIEIKSKVHAFCDSYHQNTLVKRLVPQFVSRRIHIDNNVIAENLPAGTVVGTLSLPESAQTHGFSLVPGEGDEDNGVFLIDGLQLKTRGPLHYNRKAIYTVRIRAQSSGDIEDLIVINLIDKHEVNPDLACADRISRLSAGLSDIAFNSLNHLFLVGEEGRILCSKDQGNSWEEVNSGVTDNLNRIIFKGHTGYISGWGVLLKSEDNGRTWIQLHVPLQNKNMAYAMFFFNDQKGYVAGDGGNLFYTDDGGKSWSLRNEGYSDGYRVIWFWNEEEGIAIKEYGSLHKTNDAGKTWINIDVSNLGYFNRFSNLWFVNREKGFLLSNETLFKTTDGGQHWTKDNTLRGSYLHLITFQDSETGYVGGGWSGGELFKTRNGGETWEQLSVAPISALFGVAINGESSRMFLTGNSSGLGSFNQAGHVIMSTDVGGQDWSVISQLPSEDFSSTSFPTSDIGYLFGSNSTLKTTDKGLTWKKLGITQTIYDCHFFDEAHGYVASRGTIYKTADGGETFQEVFYRNPDYGNAIHRLGVLDKDRLLAYGYGGVIYRTEDGGTNWELVREDDGVINEILFSGDVGYLLGPFGSIARSTDLGKTWTEIYTPQNGVYKSFFTIYFINTKEGFKGGANGLLEKTTDGGVTWFSIHTGIASTVRKFIFKTKLEGYVLTSSNGVYKTIDGGMTWSADRYINDGLVNFHLSSDGFYFVGANGYFARMMPGIIPAKPGYIVGDTIVCQGSAIEYVTANRVGHGYHWSVDGGELHFDGARASVFFQEPGTYEINLFHYNGCGSSDVRSLPVTVQSLSAPVINGPDSVAVGQKSVLYMLENPEPDVIISWNATPSTSIRPDHSTVVVNWQRMESNGTVSVVETDLRSGCRSKGILKVIVSRLVVDTADEAIFDFSVYPNPAQDHILINAGNGTGLRVRIYDMKGIQFHENVLQGNHTILNVEKLPAGLYFLEITDRLRSQKAIRRVIKL